ncbi:MAG: outer membrane beta-barrel protein [candidate division Zixibacteria bacterium]
MKKLVLTLTVIMLCAGLASAQISKPFNVYVGGGLGMVQGDVGTLYKTGYHGVAAVGFNAAPMIQFIGKVEYHSFGSDMAPTLGIGLDGSQRNLMFGGAAKLQPSLPAFPLKVYGLAGIGMASVQAPDLVIVNLITSEQVTITPPSQSKMYFEIGAGAELPAGPSLSMFAMVRYVSISQEGGGSFNYIPITVGLKF